MAIRRSLNKIQDDLKKKISESGKYYLERQPATMGNNSGVVKVPNTQNMVYVRLDNGQVVQVFNSVSPNIYNWKVFVGRDKSQPTLFKVLEVRWVHNIADTVAYVLFHHKQHEYPNPDTVWIMRDQFMPLLVLPVSTFTVKLFGDTIYQPSMTAPLRVPDTVIDMTAYINSTQANYVLIELTTAGVLNYVVGSNYADLVTLRLSAPIPTPTAGSFPICAVEFFAGQTSIRRDSTDRNIIDLRMFTSEATPTTGTQINTATADTPLAADLFGFWDVVDSALKKITLTNLLAVVKAYTDTLYSVLAHTHTSTTGTDIHAAATATPVGADEFGFWSVSGSVLKKLTLTALLAIVKALTDTLYAVTGHTHSYTYTDISTNDTNTDVTGAELEELTDGSVTSLHSHAGGGSGHGIQDEGTPLTSRANLNFTGTGVTASDDAGNNATVVDIPTPDADDIDDTSTTHKFTTAADITKLAGIEPGAEVNDPETDAIALTALGLHLTDTTDAHLASAIGNIPAGNIAAVDVQAAIDELDTEKQPIDADLTAIAGLTPTNDDIIQRKAGAWINRTIAQLVTDIRAVIDSVYAPIAKGVTNGDSHDHNGGDGGAIAASSVVNTPAGNIAATNVQTALNELDTEKSDTGHSHTPYSLLAEISALANVTPQAGDQVVILQDSSGNLKTFTFDDIQGLIDSTIGSSSALIIIDSAFNASGGVNYPSAIRGNVIVVTTAGKVGGASGKPVNIGDVAVAIQTNAGGSEAGVGAAWIVLTGPNHRFTDYAKVINPIIDLSANPNFPAGVIGDMYIVNAAGKIGGVLGQELDDNDIIFCKEDNAGGSWGSAGSYWVLIRQMGSNDMVFNAIPSGTVNGSNTVFTFSSSYSAGKLLLFRDGQLMKSGGEDYTETTPLSGIVTFVTAPVTGSIITGTYLHETFTSGNADTLDGHDSDYFQTIDAWIAAAGTWTYSSLDGATGVASVNADLTGILGKGDRLKYQQAQALSAYWSFDASSASGVGSFTPTDTAMTYTAGKFSNAATFNGTTSKIVITDHATLKPTGDFTLGLWFKTSNTGAEKGLFQSYSNSAFLAGISLRISATNILEFILGNNAGTAPTGLNISYIDIFGGPNVCDNAWHYAVVTLRGNWVQLYLDGELIVAQWCPIPAYAATNYVRVGTKNVSGTDASFMNGQVDDVFLINGYALDEKTIKDKYIAATAQGTGSITVTKMGMVTNVGAYSGGNTLITFWGGTDFNLANAAISSIYYSHDKEPLGFNPNPDKWTVAVITADSPTRSAAGLGAPAASTWYGGTGLSPTGPSIDLPIGAWRVPYKVIADITVTIASITSVGCRVTLSTTNSTESDVETTSAASVSLPIGTVVQRATYEAEKNIIVAVKTTEYLNIFTGNASVTSLVMNPAGAFRNVIKAISAYL